MNRTKRATGLILVLVALGGVYVQGCSSEEENTDRNGEAAALKGDCKPAADDGDPCTLEGCEGQPNAHVPTAGLPCGLNGDLTCTAAGDCGGCTSPNQCGQSTECAPWTCETGICAKTFAPFGTELSTQQPGDCKSLQCDGAGATAEVDDDNDPPTTACQLTSCANGVPMSMPAAQGTPCTVGNGKSCDGEGNCVECITDADCGQDPDIHCSITTKTCFSCKDGIQNGGESDVDCGGGQCNDCTQGKKCNVVQDCLAPTLCADGICCNTICDGPCEACNLPNSVGTCDYISKYGDDPSYGNGMSCLNANMVACTGGGACKGALGVACTGPTECASLKCGDPDGNGQKTCVKDVGDPCNQPTDCITNVCTNSVCAP